jgi:hypothetical protein
MRPSAYGWLREEGGREDLPGGIIDTPPWRIRTINASKRSVKRDCSSRASRARPPIKISAETRRV